MDTYFSEDQVLSALQVTEAYLRTWTRLRILRGESTTDGMIYHRDSLRRFMTIHHEELRRARITCIQAHQNELARASQLTFDDTLFPT